jgi:hypothetical protein
MSPRRHTTTREPPWQPILVAALLLSCAKDLDELVPFACAANKTCPTGFECASDNKCHRTGVAFGPSDPSPSFVQAANATQVTACAEEDNVNVPLSANPNLTSFTIEATHPRYSVDSVGCEPNHNDCPPPAAPAGTFQPEVRKLYDRPDGVIEAVREASWWRPNGMSVSVDDDPPFLDAHFVRLAKGIPGSPSEIPQVLVLYMDGNLRLIPLPPQGKPSVCFGSSVIVGPALVGARPIAEIERVRYTSRDETFAISYRNGGMATLRLTEITREAARVRVYVSYPHKDVPFATFRSMFVAAGNADVDTVEWLDTTGARNFHEPVASFRGGQSDSWLFLRTTPSVHNNSAPDLRISVP